MRIAPIILVRLLRRVVHTIVVVIPAVFVVALLVEKIAVWIVETPVREVVKAEVVVVATVAGFLLVVLVLRLL